MDFIQRLCRLPSRRIVGLMSGTSGDGVDACLVTVESHGPSTRASLEAHHGQPYSAELRQLILEQSEVSTARVDMLCSLGFVLAEVHARAVLQVIENAGSSVEDVDLIASHGQTVHHLPRPRLVAGVRTASTLQVGSAAVLAERTGLPVVHDFRSRDVAAGGEGAPLVPRADQLLFQEEDRCVATLNLGGIANVTHLPSRDSGEDVLAFDTGPGNILLDAAVREATGGRAMFDRGGEWAARGRVDQGLLNEMLREEYFGREPPKSTGREDFGQDYHQAWWARFRKAGLGTEDVLATLAELTARSVGAAFEQWLDRRGRPEEVLVGGGGAHNQDLLERLRRVLHGVRVTPLAERGVPVEAREALCFAVLANEALFGRPGNLPSATGARRPVVLGSFTPP